MRLHPSVLIIGLLFSAGAVLTETLPAQATLPQLQETASMEAPLSTTEARRRYRRRTRTSHRGSGRRQMIRHIL